MKKTIRQPEKFVGMRVDTNKWVIPAGYVLCAKTHKLVAEKNALITFNHHLFSRAFFARVGWYVEDADWLTEEGWSEIQRDLEAAGLWDGYIEADGRARHDVVLQ